MRNDKSRVAFNYKFIEKYILNDVNLFVIGYKLNMNVIISLEFVFNLSY